MYISRTEFRSFNKPRAAKIETDFSDINRGVPRGTVTGPFSFILVGDDNNLEDPEANLLTKFADYLTVSPQEHKIGN